jgi:hypothetical protein
MAVTYKVIVVGLLLAASGVVLLAVSAAMTTQTWGVVLVEVVKSLGGTLFATATLALVWELIARRSFTKEVLTYIQMSEELEEAGISRVSWKYLAVGDWESMFAGTQKLDLFLAYGRTWRNNYNTDLEKLAARPGVIVRVIHPDPTDAPTVAELARRFDTTAAQVAGHIQESDQYFTALAAANPRGATIERYFVQACPLFSIYLFSAQAVFALYSHTRRRTDVPTMLVEGGKPMYKYLVTEFDSLRQRATPLNPPQPPPQVGVAQVQATAPIAGAAPETGEVRWQTFCRPLPR